MTSSELASWLADVTGDDMYRRVLGDATSRATGL